MEQLFGQRVIQHPYEISPLLVRYFIELLRYLRRVDHFSGHRGGVLECIRTEQVHFINGECLEHVPVWLDL